MRMKDLPHEEYFTAGHTACPGCSIAIVTRLASKILGKNTAVKVPASCLIVFGSTYPITAWKLPLICVAFENTAAVISGMKAGYRILGKENMNVVGIAGDGGTADIGLQALSGAAERNEDVIFICNDNEAYMNTGTQRSGSTPYGALTSTTPFPGKSEFKKDVPSIVAAHRVPYVATASVGYIQDLINKLEKIKSMRGFRFLQVHAPCPPGWKFSSSLSIEVAKKAVDSGMWILYEIENGVKRITRKVNKRIPVKDYLTLQGRFKHLSPEQIETIQQNIDKSLEEINKEEGG
jgi:pyruvate/2-oxoacid:ferredoxin oxidoreductase beta subunit